MSLIPVFLVSPGAELQKRPLLFAALERALDVRFAAHATLPVEAAAGAICFSDDGEHPGWGQIPSLTLLAPHRVETPQPFRITLSKTPALSPILQGSILSETQRWQPRDLTTGDGDVVMAMRDEHPVWIRKRVSKTMAEIVSAPLDELREDEILKDRLSEDNAFSLLPLVHFVRSVVRPYGVVLPSPRAAVVIDDPNLRMFSYGHINFRSLLQVAEKCNLHLVIATIPLDMWWISRAVGTFALDQRHRLSFALHGNNHIKFELNRQTTQSNERSTVAQALRRTDRFEERYGIPVSRVMIPPHGMCARSMLGTMRSLGMEAVCVSRPTPWIPYKEKRVLLDQNRLQRWFPADWVNGMPIIHRQKSTRDFLFDAWLGQPLITYYHHSDFAHGYDWLCEVASTINRIGEITWQGLAGIAGSNVVVREEGTTLRVRPYSRRVVVAINPGIQQVVVELPAGMGSEENTTVVVEKDACIMQTDGETYVSEPVPTLGRTTMGVQLCDSVGPNRASIESLDFSWRPVVRRALTETRDRISPMISRVRSRRGRTGR